MTKNQIEYWSYVESQRANKARENENYRHNTASENETSRHNVSTENETTRHNLSTENVEKGKLAETTRHNKATESISHSQVGLGYQQLAEQKRHNVAGENISNRQLSEQQRHNMAGENLTSQDLSIKQSNVNENIRHNKKQELNAFLNTGVNAADTGVNLVRSLTGGRTHGKQQNTGTQASKNVQNISARNFIFQKR